MIRWMTFLGILSVLIGCAAPQTEYVQVAAPPIPVRCGAEPIPTRVVMETVNPFGCVSCPDGAPPEECDRDEMKTMVCIVPGEYENLAVNTEKMRTRIQQGNRLIEFYRECVKDHNQMIQEAEDRLPRD